MADGSESPFPSTDEEKRLYALLGELTADPAYVDGDAPFRGTLSVEDACAIAADVHMAVDQGTAKRAEIVELQGSRIACHAGCNACCDQLVLIWAAEAELIAAWLSAPENAAVRAQFLVAYPQWRAATGDGIDRVHAAIAAGDRDGHLRALISHWRKRVLCAFNHEGNCSIYPVRPVLCRNAHAIDTADGCHPATATASAAVTLHFVPLEEFLGKTRRLAISMHHALGGIRRRPEAVCTAVYERLQQRAEQPASPP